MTQLEIVVIAFKNLGGKAMYSDIYAEYERIIGRTLTYGQRAGIRKTIESHSSDSRVFKGRDDIFYSVLGIGNGMWGLREKYM